MLADSIDWLYEHSSPRFLLLTVAVGLLGFGLSAGLWWGVVVLQPNRVFWATVTSNLTTTGVSKHLTSDTDGTKLDQTEQINLQQKVITSQSTLTQTQGSQVTTVKTEAIATPSQNFNKYVSIKTTQKSASGTPLDFSSILNQWGKQAANNNGNGAFAQAIFDILPFAHLNQAQSQQIMTGMRQDKLYNIDYTRVKKQHKNGRWLYDYPLQLSPDVYINTLKKVDAAMGLNQLSKLDATQYEGGAPVSLTVTIDARAHQVVSLSYPGSKQTETFSSYGVTKPVSLPSKTVNLDDLKNKLSALLQ